MKLYTQLSSIFSTICKIRYSWVLFRIGSSAGADEGVKGVLFYSERNSQVWNRSEQGDIRWQCFRGGKSVGEGGPAGARARRRISHRGGRELGLGDAGTGGAGRRIFLFLLGRGRTRLRVDVCGLL